LRDNTRLSKWMKMKEHWEEMLLTNPKKIDRRVRKGIPMPLKADLWGKMSGAKDLSNTNTALYPALQQTESARVPWERQVLQESIRIYQDRYALGSQRQRALFRILRALSLHVPRLGYTTSVGYIAAYLLLFMDEVLAFWTLSTLLHDNGYGLLHLYSSGTVCFFFVKGFV